MSYAKEDGKDKVLFVDKEYVDQQPEIEVPKAKEEESKPEENDQAAAFDPETGEINWDCPCLGGMAQGPCGEEFKAAFSCFVYSNAEPKGVDCVDKFRDMQNCFRQHPDVYGDEIDDDDDEEEEQQAKPEQPAKEEQEQEQESSASDSTPAVAASSVLEAGESDGSLSSWISSWF